MAETQQEPKKSSKKLILILVAVLLLLAAGAGAGYWFFMHEAANGAHSKKDEKSGHADKSSEKEHGESAHDEEAKHDEVIEPDVYYDVPAPFLVNFPPGASAKVIKINITLLMKGESSIAALKKHEPMIRNNLLMVISSIGAEKAKTREGKQQLRELMLAEVGKVLEKMSGKNTAKDLFFTEFVMQ